LTGAAEDPDMTTRLAISPTPETGFFSPVVLDPAVPLTFKPLTDMFTFSTAIFFFSIIVATAANRGSFIEVAG